MAIGGGNRDFYQPANLFRQRACLFMDFLAQGFMAGMHFGKFFFEHREDFVKILHFHPPLEEMTWGMIYPAKYGISPSLCGIFSKIENFLNPDPSGTGFRVALRLPGMTTFACFQ
jgi:hypothetical protein